MVSRVRDRTPSPQGRGGSRVAGADARHRPSQPGGQHHSPLGAVAPALPSVQKPVSGSPEPLLVNRHFRRRRRDLALSVVASSDLEPVRAPSPRFSAWGFPSRSTAAQQGPPRWHLPCRHLTLTAAAESYPVSVPPGRSNCRPNPSKALHHSPCWIRSTRAVLLEAPDLRTRPANAGARPRAPPAARGRLGVGVPGDPAEIGLSWAAARWTSPASRARDRVGAGGLSSSRAPA